MLGLADALHQEELEKRKKLAKFADRIARIRQTDFELFQQLEQFHGLSLGVDLIEPPPRVVARDEPRRERSEPRIRPIAIKNDLGFSFIGKSERAVVDPTKRIVLAQKSDANNWDDLSALSAELAADNRRKVRRRRRIIGGGEDTEQVVAAIVAAVLEELRLTEDDETRVIEDASEERVIE